MWRVSKTEQLNHDFNDLFLTNRWEAFWKLLLSAAVIFINVISPIKNHYILILASLPLAFFLLKNCIILKKLHFSVKILWIGIWIEEAS